jgi:uncharacterized protein (TIGR02452 family)
MGAGGEELKMKDGSRLTVLPCLDSNGMAAARRRDLRLPRRFAAELGRSAVEAIRSGRYRRENGREVVWQAMLEAAAQLKLSIAPDRSLPPLDGVYFPEMLAQVTNETTLGAARRLTDRGLRPLALNFANGVCPGGGFINGARAQEEVLCRSTALFKTLVDDPMYEAHRRHHPQESTDWAILSPNVPVFRRDDGTTLEQPWQLSFISCAAPYAPAVGQPTAGDLLVRRIGRVLAIARAYGYAALVLGAWGCGAFENDPKRTARDFRSALEGEFNGAFSEVVFAVADWSKERRSLGPFRDVFAAA